MIFKVLFQQLCTRVDIYFVIGMVSKYQSNTKLEH